MKKIFRAAVFAALAAVVTAGLRRFGPALAERGMKKCHEMMAHMSQERPPEQTVQGRQEGQEGRDLGFRGEEQKTRAMAAIT